MLKSIHSRKKTVFYCLFIVSIQLFSQHSISHYELGWGLLHPINAIKVKKSLPKVMEVCKNVKSAHVLDTFESGGKLDAFRHTYAMAYLARYVKVNKLKKLGIAHEKGNKRQFYHHQLEQGERSDSLACEMDRRNNDIGLTIGSNNPSMNDEDLKNLVLIKILEGNAWYLKKNAKNEYVMCDGSVIKLEFYKEKWFIPKCLIKTNE